MIVTTAVVTERAGIDSGPFAMIARIDMGLFGFVMVAFFVVAWAVSTMAWKVFRIEERWGRPSRLA